MNIFKKLESEINRRVYNAHEMPKGAPYKEYYEGKDAAYAEILSIVEELESSDLGEISDGYHTFNELYLYRMLYNAAFFNGLAFYDNWADGSWNVDFDVHKSKKHSDGEECFGGNWFIVIAELPTGQISNHYEMKYWDLFKIPEKEFANKWDGHTPQEAAERLKNFVLDNYE